MAKEHSKPETKREVKPKDPFDPGNFVDSVEFAKAKSKA
jgi:hypothetical protein